jgi:hypothetical protein
MLPAQMRRMVAEPMVVRAVAVLEARGAPATVGDAQCKPAEEDYGASRPAAFAHYAPVVRISLGVFPVQRLNAELLPNLGDARDQAAAA